jgi:hypothetical protein
MVIASKQMDFNDNVSFVQLKGDLSLNTKPARVDKRFSNLNYNVTQKVGNYQTTPTTPLKSVSGNENPPIMPVFNGRKLINFCNYTLNQEDIINKKDLANDTIYKNYIKDQVFDYKTSIRSEIR